MKRNEKGFSVVEIIMAIVIVGLMVAVGWLWASNQNATKTTKYSTQTSETKSGNNDKKSEIVATPTPIALVAGTFGNTGNYGTAQVKGYATVSHENLGYPGCDSDPSCKYERVDFHVTETPNTRVLAYLKSFAANGNLLVTKNSFSMGCLRNGQITYLTNSDAKGTQDLTLSKTDSTALISATKEKPVAVQLEKLNATGGIDGMCLSIFTTFTLLK